MAAGTPISVPEVGGIVEGAGGVKYRLIEAVGKGSYGQVWKAVNQQSLETAAVKFNASKNQGDARDAAKKEISTLKWVTGHPNATNLVEVLQGPGYPFAMTLAPGTTQFERCQAGCLITHEEAASVMLQLISVQAQFFGQPGAKKNEVWVAHNDLSLNNLLVTGSGHTIHATLIDFGEALSCSPRKIAKHELRMLWREGYSLVNIYLASQFGALKAIGLQRKLGGFKLDDPTILALPQEGQQFVREYGAIPEDENAYVMLANLGRHPFVRAMLPHASLSDHARRILEEKLATPPVQVVPKVPKVTKVAALSAMVGDAQEVPATTSLAAPEAGDAGVPGPEVSRLKETESCVVVPGLAASTAGDVLMLSGAALHPATKVDKVQDEGAAGPEVHQHLKLVARVEDAVGGASGPSHQDLDLAPCAEHAAESSDDVFEDMYEEVLALIALDSAEEVAGGSADLPLAEDMDLAACDEVLDDVLAVIELYNVEKVAGGSAELPSAQDVMDLAACDEVLADVMALVTRDSAEDSLKVENVLGGAATLTSPPDEDQALCGGGAAAGIAAEAVDQDPVGAIDSHDESLSQAADSVEVVQRAAGSACQLALGGSAGATAEILMAGGNSLLVLEDGAAGFDGKDEPPAEVSMAVQVVTGAVYVVHAPDAPTTPPTLHDGEVDGMSSEQPAEVPLQRPAHRENPMQRIVRQMGAALVVHTRSTIRLAAAVGQELTVRGAHERVPHAHQGDASLVGNQVAAPAGQMDRSGALAATFRQLMFRARNPAAILARAAIAGQTDPAALASATPEPGNQQSRLLMVEHASGIDGAGQTDVAEDHRWSTWAGQHTVDMAVSIQLQEMVKDATSDAGSGSPLAGRLDFATEQEAGEADTMPVVHAPRRSLIQRGLHKAAKRLASAMAPKRGGEGPAENLSSIAGRPNSVQVDLPSNAKDATLDAAPGSAHGSKLAGKFDTATEQEAPREADTMAVVPTARRSLIQRGLHKAAKRLASAMAPRRGGTGPAENLSSLAGQTTSVQVDLPSTAEATSRFDTLPSHPAGQRDVAPTLAASIMDDKLAAAGGDEGEKGTTGMAGGTAADASAKAAGGAARGFTRGRVGALLQRSLQGLHSPSSAAGRMLCCAKSACDRMEQAAA